MVLFGGSLEGVSADELEEIMSHVPSMQLSKQELLSLSVTELATRSGLTSSKGEAKRLIASGGLYLNNVKVDNPAQRVEGKDLIDGRLLVLRKGKKNYLLIKAI